MKRYSEWHSKIWEHDLGKWCHSSRTQLGAWNRLNSTLQTASKWLAAPNNFVHKVKNCHVHVSFVWESLSHVWDIFYLNLTYYIYCTQKFAVRFHAILIHYSFSWAWIRRLPFLVNLNLLGNGCGHMYEVFFCLFVCFLLLRFCSNKYWS